jgi:hypothetical protein
MSGGNLLTSVGDIDLNYTTPSAIIKPIDPGHPIAGYLPNVSLTVRTYRNKKEIDARCRAANT